MKLRNLNQRWRRLALEAVVFIAALAAISLWQTRTLVAGQAPALSGQLVGSQNFDLSSWRGQPTVVHFWATWCPVCRAEESTIDALGRDYHVLTVAMNSGDAAAIRHYQQQQGVKYRVLPDPDGSIAQRWGVKAVPATFIIDGSGRIRATTVGYTTGWGLRLRLWWTGLTGG